MTKYAKRVLASALFMGTLFAAAQSVCVQAQAERQPTQQQVRAHVLDKLQSGLKNRSRGFTGWQSVQANRKGSTIYAYVQGGKVVSFAIGKPNMVPTLMRLAPSGPGGVQTGMSKEGTVQNPKKTTAGSKGETPVLTGGGVKEQQDNGDGPTEEECAAKLVKCMFDTTAIDFLRGLAMLKNVFTLDLDGLVENYEDKEASTKKCVGEACAKILAL